MKNFFSLLFLLSFNFSAYSLQTNPAILLADYEDAAKAITSAVYSFPGAYNIVNDHPSQMREWLPAFARFLGAEQPLWITEEEGVEKNGADAVYYATKLRGASNEKAKHVFHFQPRNFEWFV